MPCYLRSGKCLAETAHEVEVELKPPPQALGGAVRFRLSPSSRAGGRVKRAGKDFVGDQRELYLVEEQAGEESPYERLLGDAMGGDGALFTRENAVEAAWAVVEPVLGNHRQALAYQPGSCGPKKADVLIAADGCWQHPRASRCPDEPTEAAYWRRET